MHNVLSVYQNGTLVSSVSASRGTIESDVSAYLFACHRGTSADRTFSGTIVKAELASRNVIPFVRNSVSGMLDLNTGDFFTPTATMTIELTDN